jgi:hypothetical protein
MLGRVLEIEISAQRLVNARFTPNNGHSRVRLECPLMAVGSIDRRNIF